MFLPSASTNYISIDSDLPAMNFSVHELTVDVSIVVNELAEDDKVFSVELSLISPSSRVTIAPISAQVTIIDDNSTLPHAICTHVSSQLFIAILHPLTLSPIPSPSPPSHPPLPHPIPLSPTYTSRVIL